MTGCGDRHQRAAGALLPFETTMSWAPASIDAGFDGERMPADRKPPLGSMRRSRFKGRPARAGCDLATVASTWVRGDPFRSAGAGTNGGSRRRPEPGTELSWRPLMAAPYAILRAQQQDLLLDASGRAVMGNLQVGLYRSIAGNENATFVARRGPALRGHQLEGQPRPAVRPSAWSSGWRPRRPYCSHQRTRSAA